MKYLLSYISRIKYFLGTVVSQQRKKDDGTFSDDIEAKVEEMETKKNTRTCPNCHTVMPKQKRKCVNPQCRVDLKAAEEKLTGEV